MKTLVRRAGDRLLTAVLPKVTAKACSTYQYLGQCQMGSGPYASRCWQYVNSCGGESWHDIYDAWGNRVSEYLSGACPCM